MYLGCLLAGFLPSIFAAGSIDGEKHQIFSLYQLLGLGVFCLLFSFVSCLASVSLGSYVIRKLIHLQDIKPQPGNSGESREESSSLCN